MLTDIWGLALVLTGVFMAGLSFGFPLGAWHERQALQRLQPMDRPQSRDEDRTRRTQA